jgi:hypothetical protein
VQQFVRHWLEKPGPVEQAMGPENFRAIENSQRREKALSGRRKQAEQLYSVGA